MTKYIVPDKNSIDMFLSPNIVICYTKNGELSCKYKYESRLPRGSEIDHIFKAFEIFGIAAKAFSG